MSSQPNPPSRPGAIASLRSAEALFPSHAGQRRTKAGLDVLLTKAAIDFQNLASEHADALVRLNLEALREAAGLDALLIASFDSAHTVIEHVVGVTGLFATFNPETLRGESLERFPYLRNRLEHLRVVEIRDTSQPRPDFAPEAAQLAALRVGAALIIGFATQGQTTGFIALCSTLPRDSWDANLHLMLKLLGSSYATGIERVRYQRHLKQIEERDALALYGSNDGLWDFDLDRKTTYFSPRWKTMLGYGDDEVEPLTDWQTTGSSGRSRARAHGAARSPRRHRAAVRERASVASPRWRVAVGRKSRESHASTSRAVLIVSSASTST